MSKHMKVRAHSQPWRMGIALYIGDSKTRVKNIVMEVLNDDDACFAPEPSWILENDDAQVLMDDLWNAGVRPTDGAGTAGAMRAAENHISDLRKIAFKALKIEK